MPSLSAFLAKRIGVVVDARGLADEQGVVFRQPRVILAVDQLDVDAQGLAGLDEQAERLLVGRRHGIVRVVQDGEIVARQAAGARQAPAPLQVGRQGLDEKLLVVAVELIDVERLDGFQVPVFLAPEHHPQQRAGEGLEDVAREIRQSGIAAAPEEHIHLEQRLDAVLAVLAQTLLHHFIEIDRLEAVHRLAAQVHHGLDGRDGAVMARLGEQGGVVAHAQITVAAAQVDHLHALQLEVLLAGEVVVHVHHGTADLHEIEVVLVFQHDQLLGHSCVLRLALRSREVITAPTPRVPRRARESPCFLRCRTVHGAGNDHRSPRRSAMIDRWRECV